MKLCSWNVVNSRPDPVCVITREWSAVGGGRPCSDCYMMIIVSNKAGDQGRHIYCLLWPHLLVAGPGWPGTARLFPTEMVKLELLLHWLACLFGLGGRLTGLVLTGSRILSRDPPREFAVGLGILLWGVERVIFLPSTYITHQGKYWLIYFSVLFFGFIWMQKSVTFFTPFSLSL